MTAPAPIRPGELALRLTTDETGRTRVADLRQRYPQRITTALHCDPEYPGAAVVCVQSPSGGTFSDDELRTRIDAGAGTHLELTTQAATQVFAGAGHGARHHLQFTLGAGSLIEYLPKTVIPHTESRYTQHLEIDLAPTATYLGWDAYAAGRLGYGERFTYQRIDSAVRVRMAGRPATRDRQILEPPTASRLIGADYVATALLLAPWADCAGLLDAVRDTLNHIAGIGVGASELPGGIGVVVRLTTDSAPRLGQLQNMVLQTGRAALVGIQGKGVESDECRVHLG